VETGQSSVKIGYQWAMESFQLLKKKPLKWVLLAFVYVILFLGLPASPATPLLFNIAVFIGWPIFLVFAIGMLREVDFDRTTPFADLVEQIRPAFGKLAVLGVVCLVYGIIVAMLTKGDATLLQAVAKPGNPPPDLARIWPILLQFFVLLMPILMATWFAPPIIAFQKVSVVQAIKSSIAGSLKYAVALGVAWLVLTGVIMLGMLMIGILMAALVEVFHFQEFFLVAVTMTLSLLLATSWMLAFQYVSYRDVFDPTPVGGGEIAL
jgi:hypothetical protein